MKTVRTLLLLVIIGTAIQCSEPADRDEQETTDTVPALIRALGDEDKDVRQAAGEALSRIQPDTTS